MLLKPHGILDEYVNKSSRFNRHPEERASKPFNFNRFADLYATLDMGRSLNL